MDTSHWFGTYYYNSGYEVWIDGAAHQHWPSMTAPTTEYVVGYEATCASGDSSHDRVNATFVNGMQSHRQSDGAWISSDHGQLNALGGDGGAVYWCTFPYSIRYYLNPTNNVNVCA